MTVIKRFTDIAHSLRLSVLLIISCSTNASAQGPKAEPINGFTPTIRAKNSSTGATRHITVKGDDVRLNKAVSAEGDDLVRKLAKLLGEPEPQKSKYPIILTLYSKGNAKRGVKYSSSVVPVEGGGYVIDLVVDTRDGIDYSAVKQGIMQALIQERTMRTDPKINKETKISVPRWISDGILGAVQWKEAVTNRSVYELLKLQPNLYPVPMLFATDGEKLKELGKTKTDIYHASATAMILALQRQKEGKPSLARMLSQVAIFEGETEELLRKNFPALNVGSRGLQKLWNLQLADMSASRMLDTLTIRQTEARLAKILFFTLRGKAGVAKFIPIDDYDVLVGLADEERVQVLQTIRQNIQQLSYRCYPDYQPLLAEYSFIINDIAQGKVGDIPVRLQNLAEERARKLEAGERVRNILDWYQISEAKGLKGDFSGYEKLIKQIEYERKKNADSIIAPYVNQVEQLMKR